MNHEHDQDSHETEASESSLWDDPLVEEVRAIRRQLWEASGRDIRQFIERSRQADLRRAREESRDDAH